MNFIKPVSGKPWKSLSKQNNSLFDGAVSILLRGELKNWSDSVPEGEVHTFEFPVIKMPKTGMFKCWWS